tara:strand:+ start:383 stop:535 length:153 start_codon:yes stop_codon:yes gene_type:complete
MQSKKDLYALFGDPKFIPSFILIKKIMAITKKDNLYLELKIIKNANNKYV